MLLTYPVQLVFEVGDDRIASSVRLSRGPAPHQYRLEEALFPKSISDYVDEDAWHTELWVPPATYHDLIEAHLDEDDALGPVLVFRRLLERARDRRFAFILKREYLTPSPLHTESAQVLRLMVKAMGGYYGDSVGSSEDHLLIVLPDECTFDPTADVERLGREPGLGGRSS